MGKNLEKIQNGFCVEEINKIINRDCNVGLTSELEGVIYSLGRDVGNNEEYEYAFSCLLFLSKSPIKDIRVKSILGFSLLAYSVKKLDREIVEPIIISEWSNADIKQKGVIETAVEDINFFLKWDLML